ncbi:hypothetical protein J4429_06180 [Candidatus Pacearchaeota archaeon]|nr:hypothetical protein [Candidatus Pacearchaeota archaeon]
MGFARIKTINGEDYVYWIHAYREEQTGKPKQEVKYLCKLAEIKTKFRSVIKWMI